MRRILCSIDGKAISYDDMKRMLVSSRWSMGFSYALMQIAALAGFSIVAGLALGLCQFARSSWS